MVALTARTPGKTEHLFIQVDKEGKVRISPGDIETIANLVVRKLNDKESNHR